jgi:toxin ParE1/3/4
MQQSCITEDQQKGLGNQFYKYFLLALENIETKPFTYSFVKDPVRRCRIQKFPYKVFYLISENYIFIIGLSHAKRSNAVIKRRLKLI